MNFQQAMTEFFPQIDAEMKRAVIPADGNLDPFWGMMMYHLGWVDRTFRPVQTSAGKRLRPVFTMLACRAEGGDVEKSLPAAAAVELLHNFTLIHDDIQDNSHTRRGRPTVWKLWGVPQAINAGDAMFTLARHTVLQLKERGISADTVLAAIDCLDKTLLSLCRGQYLDMTFEETILVKMETYLEMIAGKTAALLACSGYLGALLATESTAIAQRYWQLGHALGMAFQMHDDILGIWGDSAIVGKTAGDDLRQHKKSLPVVYLLNQLENDATRRFREIYRHPKLTDDVVAEAMTLLETIGAKTYAERETERYTRQAQQHLDALHVDAGRKRPLQEMLAFLLERTY